MAALLGVLPGTEAGRGDVGNSYSVANLLFGWIGSGAGLVVFVGKSWNC